VIKGGHLVGDAIDIFYDGKEFTEFIEQRIKEIRNKIQRKKKRDFTEAQ